MSHVNIRVVKDVSVDTDAAIKLCAGFAEFMEDSAKEPDVGTDWSWEDLARKYLLSLGTTS